MCNECQARLDAAHRGLTEACSIPLIITTEAIRMSRYETVCPGEEIWMLVLGLQQDGQGTPQACADVKLHAVPWSLAITL